jgi:hypothetical protein
MLGCLVGAALFVLTAIAGERNALWIPAIVLIFAGALQAIAGPIS